MTVGSDARREPARAFVGARECPLVTPFVFVILLRSVTVGGASLRCKAYGSTSRLAPDQLALGPCFCAERRSLIFVASNDKRRREICELVCCLIFNCVCFRGAVVRGSPGLTGLSRRRQRRGGGGGGGSLDGVAMRSLNVVSLLRSMLARSACRTLEQFVAVDLLS
jgi:hypothetical protein